MRRLMDISLADRMRRRGHCLKSCRALAQAAERRGCRVRCRAHDSCAGHRPADYVGTSPEDVVDVTGRIPDPSNEANAERRKNMEAALKYMGLRPGDAIEGTPIDWVFIGSCTNGRLSDLREAAKALAGQKIAASVRAWIVPGS